MKDKTELLRLKTLIESDRLTTHDNFSELVLNDVSNVLKDYFEFREIPTISIDKQNNKLKIDISFSASRIKNFGVLPK